MQPNRDQIKDWLKNIGKDRFWLAEQFGVEKVSVDGWFSRNKFPSKAMLIIKKLMDTTYPSLTTLPDLDNRGKMELRLDYETQRKVEKEALRLGMELSTYCTMAVEWCSEQENIGERLAARLAAQQEDSYLRVAEDDVEYGNQGTKKREMTKQSLPSPQDSADPSSQKRTTGETLGVLRLGPHPDAKRKSGSA